MTDLYRHFDKDDNLLYVGISLSTLQRLGQHKRNARWFNSITRIEIEKCADRAEALNMEAQAIKKEKPIYNIQHAKKVKAKSYGIKDLYDCLRSLGITEGWVDEDMEYERPADIYDGVTISLGKLARLVNSSMSMVESKLSRLVANGRIKVSENVPVQGCNSYIFDIMKTGHIRCKAYLDSGVIAAHHFQCEAKIPLMWIRSRDIEQ